MGLFQSIVQKYKDAKQKSLNKEEYKKLLFDAVNDGKLTKKEIGELEKKKDELALTDKDIDSMRVDAYEAAFSVVSKDQKVTKEEEEELNEIQKYLGVDDSDIESDKKELTRLRLIYEIQQGNLPTIAVTNLIMQKGEKAHWSEPATLVEERVVKRNYVGGSSGMSFRVMKGVSYRVGSYRGHAMNQTGKVAVSNGSLVITNRRLIFQGDSKSFAVPLDKVLSIQLFTNGINFSENNRSKPKLIKFEEEGNNDIIGAILTYAINHYGK